MASRVPSKDVSKDTPLGSRESERSLVSRSWQTDIQEGRERYNYLIEFIRPTLVDLSRDDRFNPPRRHHSSSPNSRPISFFLFFFFSFLPFVLHLSSNRSITNLKSGNLLLVIRSLISVDPRVDDVGNLLKF